MGLSCSFIVSVRRCIQDKGTKGALVADSSSGLINPPPPNNFVMKTSSVNCQLYLSVPPPFGIRVIYKLSVEESHSAEKMAHDMELRREVAPKMTAFIT